MKGFRFISSTLRHVHDTTGTFFGVRWKAQQAIKERYKVLEGITQDGDWDDPDDAVATVLGRHRRSIREKIGVWTFLQFTKSLYFAPTITLVMRQMPALNSNVVIFTVAKLFSVDQV